MLCGTVQLGSYSPAFRRNLLYQSSTVKLKAAGLFETLVYKHQTVRCYVPVSFIFVFLFLLLRLQLSVLFSFPSVFFSFISTYSSSFPRSHAHASSSFFSSSSSSLIFYLSFYESKVRSGTGHERPEGEQSQLQLYSFFNLGARQRWVFNVTPRPLCSRERDQYPLYRRQGGPQGPCERVRKISPPPGLDPRASCQ